MGNCKICEKNTETIFNIGFKAINICESCATSVFIQQAKYYTQSKRLDTDILASMKMCITQEMVPDEVNYAIGNNECVDRIRKLYFTY